MPLPLLLLPQEIICLIANELSTTDLLHLLQTNEFLYEILRRELYKKDIKANGGMSLSFQAFWGHESRIHEMLELGASIDIANPRWRDHSPLMLAASRNHVSVMRVLIDNGANVNHICYRTPLEVAILNAPPDDLSSIQLLLDRGALVNLRGNKRRTPLFTAVAYGSSEAVTLLLDNGADLNVSDENGRTVLSIAWGLRPERQQWLLDMGAME